MSMWNGIWNSFSVQHIQFSFNFPFSASHWIVPISNSTVLNLYFHFVHRGLQFLHTIGDKPLVHGDIKPANILLDKNDFPRIGDFGLAREGTHEEYVRISKVHGTRPYLPDEFLKLKKFSPKVDTFSFGIVLFEIATGLTAYSNRRPNKFLRDHVVDYEGDILELKDPRESGGDYCFRRIINIGMNCVREKAENRPDMVKVLKALEDLVEPDEGT